MTDRKERGKHKNFIFLPCDYLLNTQRLVEEMASAQFLLLSTSWSSGGRPKFNMPETSLTRDYPGAPPPCLAASLDSQSCHQSIKTLGLPSAPPYAGIKPQLAPSDFNFSFRIAQNFPFFSFPLFGLRVKEWARISQANMFGRHSKKQNSLHQDTVCESEAH